MHCPFATAAQFTLFCALVCTYIYENSDCTVSVVLCALGRLVPSTETVTVKSQQRPLAVQLLSPAVSAQPVYSIVLFILLYEVLHDDCMRRLQCCIVYLALTHSRQ